MYCDGVRDENKRKSKSTSRVAPSTTLRRDEFMALENALAFLSSSSEAPLSSREASANKSLLLTLLLPLLLPLPLLMLPLLLLLLLLFAIVCRDFMQLPQRVNARLFVCAHKNENTR